MTDEDLLATYADQLPQPLWAALCGLCRQARGDRPTIRQVERMAQRTGLDPEELGAFLGYYRGPEGSLVDMETSGSVAYAPTAPLALLGRQVWLALRRRIPAKRPFVIHRLPVH